MSICKRYSREQLFKKIYLDYESKIKYFVFWIFEFLKGRAFKNWSFNCRKNWLIGRNFFNELQFLSSVPKFIDARDE